MKFYGTENCSLRKLKAGKCEKLKMKRLKQSFFMYLFSDRWFDGEKKHIKFLFFHSILEQTKVFLISEILQG